MKNFHRIVVGTALVAALALLTHTTLAHGNDRGNAKATIGQAHITIDYGRPSLNGRDPLSLIKPGAVWRMGSDASTTLETDQDLMVGGTRVPKGKHIILARYDAPGKWALVFSSKPYNQYEASAKIAETPMTVENAKASAETVSISLTNKNGTGVIELAWGKMLLKAEFKPAS
jgi:hypothetical protein